MYVVCALSLSHSLLETPFVFLCSCSKLCLLLWFHAVVSSSGLEPLIGVLEEMLRRAYACLYDGIEKCDGLKVYLCSSWSNSSQAYLAPPPNQEAAWGQVRYFPCWKHAIIKATHKIWPFFLKWWVNNDKSISQVGGSWGIFYRTTNWYNIASSVPLSTQY